MQYESSVLRVHLDTDELRKKLKTNAKRTKSKMTSRLTRCFCCTVRTGALVVASLTLAAAALEIAAYSFVIGIDTPSRLIEPKRTAVVERYERDNIEKGQWYWFQMDKFDMIERVMDGLNAGGLGLGIAWALVAILLLVGILRHKHKLMVPWLAFACVMFVVNCFLIVALPVTGYLFGMNFYATLYLIVGFVLLLLQWYFLRVVHSEYKNIKEANLRAASSGDKEESSSDTPYKIMA